MRPMMKVILFITPLLVLGIAILLSTDLSFRQAPLSGLEPVQAVEDGTDHNHPEGTKYTCGMHPMIIVDDPGLCPICHMELTPMKTDTGGSSASSGERQVKYWQAPMDPTYISDEPGKSPMGMDLIPVYEDQATGGSMISIDPTTIQNMGVRTAAVVRGDLSRSIRTVGLVGYEEAKQYIVNAKIAGWVEKLYVSETANR